MFFCCLLKNDPGGLVRSILLSDRQAVSCTVASGRLDQKREVDAAPSFSALWFTIIKTGYFGLKEAQFTGGAGLKSPNILDLNRFTKTCPLEALQSCPFS